MFYHWFLSQFSYEDVEQSLVNYDEDTPEMRVGDFVSVTFFDGYSQVENTIYARIVIDGEVDVPCFVTNEVRSFLNDSGNIESIHQMYLDGGFFMKISEETYLENIEE